tara:strand:+ start:429 stop:2438 length:2010 start_codon:yes stop_codon:yes gene_type:complete
MKKLILKLLFIFYIISLFSCKHEIENPSWTVDLIAPIAKDELKLTDLLKESDVYLDTNNNDQLILVYQLNSIDTNLNDFISEDELSFSQNDLITIPEFEIPDIEVELGVSLGKIIKGTTLEDVLVNDTTIIISNSFNLSIPANNFPIPSIPNFNELIIESAKIEIKLTNDLPAAIDDFSFIIKNQDPNNQINNDNIVSIPSTGKIYLESDNDTIIIQELEEILFTNLIEILSGNYSFVANSFANKIDTSLGLIFDIKIRDIIVSKIQGLIENNIPLDSIKSETFIDIETINAKNVRIDSGSINISFNTILDMPIQFKMYSPNLIPNDTITISVNEGNGSDIIDLSGMMINFKGRDNDTINTFYYEIYGFIPPTNITYSTATNNEISYEISSYIKPKYVIGDFGDDISLDIPKDSFEFDFFNDLDLGGDFSIESANITLGIENYIGVGCAYSLNVNSNNSLNGSSSFSLINGSVDAADLNQNLEIVTPNYIENNQDLAALINIKPNLITIDGQVDLYSGLENFVFYDKGITITPNIEIPLSFIASNLILSDTSEIELPKEINNAELKIIIDNGYPLNTQVEVVFLDENYIALETKLHSINSGKISEDGRIYESTRSTMKIELDEENIEKIKFVNYIAYFETSSQTEYRKIYSDYSIVIQLIANYKSSIGE